MHVKRADVLPINFNLQSFVTDVGKFHSVRRIDERSGKKNRLI